jgi:hypothetical protein
MSQSASQAAIFYREVAAKRVLWTIRDDRGFPAPESEGRRAMPFWSSRSRAERVIKNVGAYAGFHPVEVTLAEFETGWVPDLKRQNQLVGVNWSGALATGYDVDPDVVLESIRRAQTVGRILPFQSRRAAN